MAFVRFVKEMATFQGRHSGDGGMRLNLGCGDKVHPLWTNVDHRAGAPGVLAHDLSRDLPFPDGGCECVYASHVIEHFTPRQATRLVSECFRTLKSGGVLRLVVPDMEAIARLYLSSLESAESGAPGAADRYDWVMLELLDQMVRTSSGGEMITHWSRTPVPEEDFVRRRAGPEFDSYRRRFEAGQFPSEFYERDGGLMTDGGRYLEFRASGELHLWMYDRFSLARLLKKVGFVDVKRRRADESLIEGFVGFHLDTEPDGTVRKPDSLYMEGVKP